MAKNGFIAWVDNLPWILKLILCIPLLDIVWCVYRIIKHAVKFNLIRLIISIVLVVCSVATWLLDLIWVILFNKCFLG